MVDIEVLTYATLVDRRQEAAGREADAAERMSVKKRKNVEGPAKRILQEGKEEARRGTPPSGGSEVVTS